MMRDPIVFLIEDDDDVRGFLGYVLRSAGLAVRTFSSGPAFLEQYDPEQPGCLVCDVCMPAMTGWEVQCHLAQRGPGVPIIYITAFASIDDAVCALKAGAVDYLQKPFTNDALLASVRRALGIDARQRQRQCSDAAIKAQLANLTPGEREVFDLLLEGHPNKVIASKLNLTYKAVETRRARVMRKIGARSLPELCRKMIPTPHHPQLTSPREQSVSEPQGH